MAGSLAAANGTPEMHLFKSCLRVPQNADDSGGNEYICQHRTTEPECRKEVTDIVEVFNVVGLSGCPRLIRRKETASSR